MEDRLTGLVVPEVDAPQAAGHLLEDLPMLWREAADTERRTLLLTMLDWVYLETKDLRCVVMIRPKPPFRPLLEIATTREDSPGELIHKATPTALEDWPEPLCFWWRRGGVEPPVQRTPR